jgi:hypothetical protein
VVGAGALAFSARLAGAAVTASNNGWLWLAASPSPYSTILFDSFFLHFPSLPILLSPFISLYRFISYNTSSFHLLNTSIQQFPLPPDPTTPTSIYLSISFLFPPTSIFYYLPST